MSKGKQKPSLYNKAKTRRISPEIDFRVSVYMSQSESIQANYYQKQLTKV